MEEDALILRNDHKGINLVVYVLAEDLLDLFVKRFV